MLQGSYICQADPDQLCGDLSLIPTFSRKCGLQSESHSHENNDEPLSRKRRLTLDQTKSLEQSYSKDNKLEADQKNKLALELGLQPRQVAIWYQNRRARSKAKSIEGKYNALKLQYQEVVLKNRRLEAEVSSLREKLETKEKTENESKRHPDSTKTSKIYQKQTETAGLCKNKVLLSAMIESEIENELNIVRCETNSEDITSSDIVQHFDVNNSYLMNGGNSQINSIGLELTGPYQPQEQLRYNMTENRFHPHFQEHYNNLSSIRSLSQSTIDMNPKNEEYLVQLATCLAHLDEQFFNHYPFKQHDVTLCLYCNLASQA